MPEPRQTTILGTTEPLRAPKAPPVPCEQAPLFTAPQTIRGQLALQIDDADVERDLIAASADPPRT